MAPNRSVGFDAVKVFSVEPRIAREEEGTGKKEHRMKRSAAEAAPRLPGSSG